MSDAIEYLVHGVPEGRSRRLLRRVLERLPVGWDHYRTFDVELLSDKPSRGYGSCRRDEALEASADDLLLEGHAEQCWAVTLYQPWLDAFSDDAALWIIAHELGHVASGMACGTVVVGGVAYTRMAGTDDDYRPVTPEDRAGGEKIADAIARAWGFWAEEEAFAWEDERLTRELP